MRQSCNEDRYILWDISDLPALDSNQFQPYIDHHYVSPDNLGELIKHMESKEDGDNNYLLGSNPLTYSSFGDHGVTASLNARGNLLQFSSFLDAGTSGMFCVDEKETPPPSLVENRADELLGIDKNLPWFPYGLLNDTCFLSPSRVSYVCDRWPRYEFSDKEASMKSTVQWMVHQGTVLQQWRIRNEKVETQEAFFRFLPDMLIRDLDHVHEDNNFNKSEKNQVQTTGPHGYGLVLYHSLERFTGYQDSKDLEGSHYSPPAQSNSESSGRLPAETLEEPDIVAVIVNMFTNGQAVRFNGLQFHEPLNVKLEPQSSAEITVAYKLFLVPKNGIRSWRDFLIRPEDTDVTRLLAQDLKTFARFSISPSDLLLWSNEFYPDLPDKTAECMSYVIGRNVEHILSVCSIPIRMKEGNIVALTYGDITGHRVSIAGSFFAFSFLLEVLTSFCKNNENPRLENRIKSVCQGHLNWLWLAMKNSSNSAREGLATSRWVTGNPIFPGELFQSESKCQRIDTAYQLIKLDAFETVFTDRSEGTSIDGAKLYNVEDFLNAGKEWAEDLKTLDKRREWTWPRLKMGDCDRYRLSDHVWIWRGLEAQTNLEHRHSPEAVTDRYYHLSAGLSSQPHVSEADRYIPKGEAKSDRGLSTKTPSDIREEILKRFSTVNDLSSERMIATMRSSRENRFLFHGGDTVLLHTTKLELFDPKSPFYDRWQSTLDAQMHHSTERDSDNLMDYAFNLMIGLKGKSVKSSTSAPRLVADSLRVLLGSTGGPQALFHGQIDEDTKNLVMFRGAENRDWYFRASFEIPYILAITFQQGFIRYNQETSAKNATSILPGVGISSDRVQNFNTYQVLGSIVPTRAELQRRKQQAMEKYIPTNNLIDQQNIHEISDEWLYCYPKFLKRLKTQGEIIFTERLSLIENASSHVSFMMRAPEHYQGLALNESSSSKSLLVDIPKIRSLRGKSSDSGKREHTKFTVKIQNTYLEFWKILALPREPETAKKRFVWLPNAAPIQAVMCVIASPEEEMQQLMLFFEKHSQYANHFSEEANLVMNVWNSELHFCFYRLIEDHQTFPDQLVTLSDSDCIALSEQPKRQLVRASTGFRFNGDMFDRHWTCHLVESIPGKEPMFERTPWNQKIENGKISLYPDLNDKSVGERGCWRQRRVLELQLLDRMLTEISLSTKRIIDNIQEELGVGFRNSSFTINNSDAYFSSRSKWQKYQQILQLVEADISAALDVINRWEVREKDRGNERPRWTRKDEAKYRALIRKFEGSNRRRIVEVRKQQVDLWVLKDTLVNRQSHIRDELSLQGSESIRFFTYVTVVFLPLGFSASIFSMNGAPPKNVLQSMALCAVVTLFLTIVVLLNTKAIRAAIRVISDKMEDETKRKMGSSTLYSVKTRDDQSSPEASAIDDLESGKESQRDPEAVICIAQEVNNRDNPMIGTENQPQIHPNGPEQQNRATLSVKETKLSKGWFWLQYLVFELPAQKVIFSCIQLKSPHKADYRTYLHLVYGLLFLPMFCTTLILQIMVYNLIDLASFCWGYVPRIRRLGILNESKEEAKELLCQWTYPLKRFRPLYQDTERTKDLNANK